MILHPTRRLFSQWDKREAIFFPKLSNPYLAQFALQLDLDRAITDSVANIANTGQALRRPNTEPLRFVVVTLADPNLGRDLVEACV